MHDGIERAARDHLARVLDSDVSPDAIDLDANLDGYGLTSLNKVLFLTSLCEAAGVPLSRLTEQDVARMRSLREVIGTLGAHPETGSPR